MKKPSSTISMRLSLSLSRGDNLTHPQWAPLKLPKMDRVKTRKNGYGYGLG